MHGYELFWLADAIVVSQSHDECAALLKSTKLLERAVWQRTPEGWLCFGVPGCVLTTVKCDNHSMGEPSARLPRVSERREQSISFQIVKRTSKLLP